MEIFLFLSGKDLEYNNINIFSLMVCKNDNNTHEKQNLLSENFNFKLSDYELPSIIRECFKVLL